MFEVQIKLYFLCNCDMFQVQGVDFCFLPCFRYEVFHKDQNTIVKQYPDMVKSELGNYDEALCKLFAVNRNNPVRTCICTL